ncbi:MAG: transcription elongation factor GreA [Saprospiraceae bacterium]|nr:transcription elongation factor GreA [Saprospiraceae bacterium]
MAQYTLLTQGGYEKMKAELEVLRTTGRKEAARAIAEAREKGDLSENAEYDAAKDAQGLLEAKIAEIEGKLGNARIIDESQLDDSKISVLSTVTIENVKLKKQVTYKLVPESEADLKTGKISVNSPVGQGLLGKEVGDIAYVSTPNGKIEFKVLKISID